MEQFLQLKAEIKELKARQDACSNAIKQRLGESTQGYGNRYTATWKPQTRRTFDAKRFGREHPEIDLSGYYNRTEIRKFEVKEI